MIRALLTPMAMPERFVDTAPDGAGTTGNVSYGTFTPSFVDLYRDNFVPMVRLAVLLTGSESLAEDLVHDAFVRVHARWSRVESPTGYLRAAVVNACRSARRRATLERSVAVASRAGFASLDADEMFDALSTLPYRQRAAIVLKYYEGLSQSEIAGLLSCREGTVASLVHRGLEHLRRTITR
jgi:RNA polymerase sigma factor (sigma-70 family)